MNNSDKLRYLEKKVRMYPIMELISGEAKLFLDEIDRLRDENFSLQEENRKISIELSECKAVISFSGSSYHEMGS